MFELFAGAPTFLIITFVAIFGLIIGSFLNVFIYRFHTGKSLMGNSHCLSCGTNLKPYELVPVLSYLALRGKCRNCSSFIPTRYFLVESATSLLFVGVLFTESDIVLFLLMAILMAVLLVTAVYDLYHMVIPDEFVILATVIALIKWFYLLVNGASSSDFLISIAAALGAGLFFFLLWFQKGHGLALAM
jgi:leader peptidase (prepilin peptidase) / N-methyltransferase